MSIDIFRGSFVAMITPFDRKKRIDRQAIEELVEWHIQEGTNGIVCCGSTGESVVLSDRERKEVAEVCIRVAAKRIPIVVNTGTCDTRQSVRLTEQMKKLGAEGALVVVPYYNKPSQKGCIAHFREVAKAGLPIIVYHNPGRTIVRLTAETIAEIGQFSNVAAIKESSRDMDLIDKIQKLSKISIFSGEDDLSCQIIEKGGIGTISVINNLVPRGWSKMIRLALAGKKEEAKAFLGRYLPLFKAIFLETNPQGLKFAMKWLGKIEGDLRLPLVMPEISTQLEIKRALVRLSLSHWALATKIQSEG